MRQEDKPHQISIGPQAFKDALYGDTETGWLTIFYTPSRRTVWLPVTDPIPDLDLEQNCYLGIGVRKQRPHNGQGRGRTDDVIGIPGLWLDLDYQSPDAHKTRHPLPPSEDAALSLLEVAPYKPSLIVHSGHGLQVYWLFKELARFDTEDDREAFSRLCSGWQRLFRQAGSERGWHVDSTADLARVLRIPGTRNLKTNEAREVTVREANAFRYSPADFSDFAALESSAHQHLLFLCRPTAVSTCAACASRRALSTLSGTATPSASIPPAPKPCSPSSWRCSPLDTTTATLPTSA